MKTKLTSEQILSLTPRLPGNFIEMLRELFAWQHYLFVWRNDEGNKTAYCTACRKEFVIDIDYMRTVTPNDRILFYKKHNETCFCPNCNEHVIYKDKNRGRGKLWQENYLYFFQPLRGGGLILRGFYLHLSHEISITANVEYSEHQRIYYAGGKAYRFQRRPLSGSPYFYFCDWYNAKIAETQFEWLSMASVSTPKPWTGRLYSGFKGYAKWVIDNKALEGEFKYSCLKEYLESRKDIEYRDACLYTCAEYLALYQKNPSLIEKMMKQGFESLIWYHLNCKNLHRIINFRKPDFYQATKLSKAEIKNVAACQGIFSQIQKIFEFQASKIYGLTPKNAAWVAKSYMFSIYYLDDWLDKLRNNSPDFFNKHLKYFRKQKIKHYLDYADYKRQLKELKIPLTQENLYPHNFNETHVALTVEINRRKNAKKRAAAVREEKEFRKKYKELLSDLYFEDESFIIRPAKGDAELLDEGTVLSHCVHSYSERYKRGDTVICVIREKKNPEKPFYTLELSPDFTQIIQCRGKCNRGTTPEVEAFKKKWFARLQAKPGKEKLCQKTA